MLYFQVAVAAGSLASLKRTVRRAKKGNTPAEPATIRDIPVPLPIDYNTHHDETFLVYDNEESQNRVLMFATNDGLDQLNNADTWFMDGTHSTAPKQFQQLFVIRVPLGESCVSVMYALLPSKQQSMYEEVLTALLDICLQRDIRPNLRRVVADYEMAIHNAVTAVLDPNIHIQVG